ncbi:MAG: YkgJ family cysteine cluster protein [Synergistaceae bacterium]|nr:YkgJ family cysteine cluster protein [Synergistota bacterium]NLM71028.1 YkgJ family cysteine cluster protein [Synergistaceae bacterium]
MWWDKGLRFTCLGCGRCCRGAPGAIYFTLKEEEEISSFLSLEVEDFRRRYVTSRWGARSFRERGNGDCIFFDAKSARCTIYPVRPLQCSLFPFWPSRLESEEEWNETAAECPGMNQGELHRADKILSLLSENPFPDLL